MSCDWDYQLISGRNILAAAIMLVLFTSIGFGDAIQPGFNSVSDGRNDDGTYTTGGCNNDFDGGTCSGTQVSIGFNTNFYGTAYGSIYINTNGNITFDAPLSSKPFPLVAGFSQIIAPFFADVDTRNPASGVVTFGAGVFDGYPAFGVNWNNVGYFVENADKLNNFQLLLVNRPDTGAGNFDIVFDYGTVQWETGDADFGNDGIGGFSARAGFSDGSGDPANSYELPGSGVAGSFIDGGTNALISHSLNSTVDGQYIFYVRDGTVNTTPVPEPATLALLIPMVLFVFFRRVCRERGCSR